MTKLLSSRILPGRRLWLASSRNAKPSAAVDSTGQSATTDSLCTGIALVAPSPQVPRNATRSHKRSIEIDRKVLSDIAGNDSVGFKAIADKVRAALA